MRWNARSFSVQQVTTRLLAFLKPLHLRLIPIRKFVNERRIKMEGIQMVDLIGQHQKIENELREAMGRVLATGAFVKGPEVQAFVEVQCPNRCNCQSWRFCSSFGLGRNHDR